MSAFAFSGGGPTAPVAGMEAWYDAADTGTLTVVSNRISQWDDKSGNGYDLTQGTSGDRPYYDGTPRSINGIICLETTGSAEYMESSLSMSDRTSTHFFVGLLDAFDRGPFGSVGGSGGFGVQVYSTSNLGIRAVKEGVTFLSGSTYMMPAAGTPFIFCVRLSATAWDASVGGMTSASLADSESFTASRTFRIGAENSLTVPWDGLIGEYLNYSTTLSDADMYETLSYLTNKWLAP